MAFLGWVASAVSVVGFIRRARYFLNDCCAHCPSLRSIFPGPCLLSSKCARAIWSIVNMTEVDALSRSHRNETRPWEKARRRRGRNSFPHLCPPRISQVKWGVAVEKLPFTKNGTKKDDRRIQFRRLVAETVWRRGEKDICARATDCSSSYASMDVASSYGTRFQRPQSG